MGQGGPVIAILGECDALPALGQEPGVAEQRPLSYAGHGCGHNLLGSAALLAAVALRDWLAETGTPGRVRYYGCPAEKGTAGRAKACGIGVYGCGGCKLGGADTVQAWVTTCALGTPFHSWQLTAQGKSPGAHKGMSHAAKIMAATGRDLFARPDILAEAKAEHAAKLAREPYVCPLEPEVMPPIPA